MNLINEFHDDDDDHHVATNEEEIDQHEQREQEDGGEEEEAREVPTEVPPPSEVGTDSLAYLLVDMTEKVQEERTKRGEVEKRNHSLLMELDQLQKEVLGLCAAAADSERKASEAAQSDTKSNDGLATMSNGVFAKSHIAPGALDDAEAGEFCWKELLDAKKAKEKALAEAHQRAMQVMELNACISMQHDELTALRTRVREDREALEQSEAAAKELRQERQLLTQEMKLLRDNVEHLTAEMGKRGTHFKAIMEKWTEAQAQSEHRERENAALREQLQAARQRAELRERELETLRDERDALQHQANQLKGAVAAKAAESKVFQTYGASAREHLQIQQAAIQRHAVYRRQVNGLARDAITSLRGMRAILVQTRAPLVAIQGDFRRFLERLRVPVMTLVERSSRSLTSWDTELEIMTKRYGKDALESLDMIPPTPYHHEMTEYSQQQPNHHVAAPTAVHPVIYSNSSPSPPPAQVTSVRKPKSSRRGSKGSRSSGGQAASAAKKQAATILMPNATRAVRSTSMVRTTAAPTAIAPPTTAPVTIGAVLKIRRETASSALKKTLLSRKLQDKRTPFR
ncbi:di-glucose binding protein with kinesin motor domain [Phytophthora cinnamomi]|uniref:di-glucose binding protein with kinesin motor domain n=2 Tax=Phytophthora cinnamomi TaxID=4785 RepID=UPI003559D87A|nr:di-glucose binding protein with kinesin motor domain [Phytophthora cinnamomi]